MLRQPAADERDAAVRWRQLVDLIARAGAQADPQLLEEALAAIRSDSQRVAEPLRAAAARAIAALPLPLGLLECFIADKLAVSAPILAAAALDRPQWQALLRSSDAETRRFVETLHPDIALGIPVSASAGEAAPNAIGDLVARIERRRNRAGVGQPQPPPPSPPPSGAGQAFRWEAGANGEIDWVEGAPRGAMIGRSIARPADWRGESVAEDTLRAFAARAPFRDCKLVVAGSGAAAGAWLLSGSPAFDPTDGRFCGYRGNARRSRESLEDAPQRLSPDAPEMLVPHLPLDGDSLRELVHELRTPLNAIIGFSEIIDGQYLGPAGRRYRQRAGDIAESARILLESIDDLDLAAKSQRQGAGRASPSDLAAIAARLIPALAQAVEKRGVELVFTPPARPVTVAADPALVARLAERLVRALVTLAVSGERLRLEVTAAAGQARLVITRPVALAGASLNATDQDFALSMARALTRIGGGDILVEGGEIALVFPAA